MTLLIVNYGKCKFRFWMFWAVNMVVKNISEGRQA